MRALTIQESFLQPKTHEDIIKSLFGETRLDVNPNTMFYYHNHGILGNLGERFLIQNNIEYEKIKHNEYIMHSSLINFVLYFKFLNWSTYEIKEHLLDKLYEA